MTVLVAPYWESLVQENLSARKVAVPHGISRKQRKEKVQVRTAVRQHSYLCYYVVGQSCHQKQLESVQSGRLQSVGDKPHSKALLSGHGHRRGSLQLTVRLTLRGVLGRSVCHASS